MFVDDLDRCEVPRAAELMQAINMMIGDDPQIIFVIGMDRRKVAAGIAVKHKLIIEQLEGGHGEAGASHLSGLRFGYSYLEKFIQVPFILPRPTDTDIRRFLAHLAGPLRDRPPPTNQHGAPRPPEEGGLDAKPAGTGEDPSDEKIRRRIRLEFEGDSDHVRELCVLVAPALDNNPRRIKQFLNLLRLRFYLAVETGLFDEHVESSLNRLTVEQLAKFTALTVRWPLLVAQISDDPPLLERLQRLALGEPPEDELAENHWAQDGRLMSLLAAGCTKPAANGAAGDAPAEDDRYSLIDVDVARLLDVAVPPPRESIVFETPGESVASEAGDAPPELDEPEAHEVEAAPAAQEHPATKGRSTSKQAGKGPMEEAADDVPQSEEELQAERAELDEMEREYRHQGEPWNTPPS